MKTILHKVVERAKNKPDSMALMYKVGGRWVEESWRSMYDKVECLAYALSDLGICRGDRVSIQAWTRPEWTIADLAVTLTGGIVVPLYPQYPPAECRYILDHAGVKFIFCEDEEQLDKVEGIRPQLPALTGMGLFEAPKKERPGVHQLETLIAKGRAIRKTRSGLIEEWLDTVKPRDAMTIVYTSGTTGHPKGVVLCNDGFDFGIDAISRMFGLVEGQRLLAFLPLAHVYERFMQYMGLSYGLVYSYAGSLETLGERIREIKPHYMPGVPRVYEKAYAAINAKIDSGPPWRKRLASWALDVGRRVVETKQADRPVGLMLSLQNRVADRLVFAKIRQALGGNLRCAAVSAAPISAEICTFFTSIGIPMLEAWGMTETTAPVTVNPPAKPRMGTAGPPFKGAQVKIAEDGEILVKSPNVLLEYYHDEEATRAAFDSEGFFFTGDLGQFDDHGYLKIVGRKKDILITSYGKNITVRNVEDRFMMEALIAACVIFGDGKPFLSAVFSLAQDPLLSWAKSQGLGNLSYVELVQHPKVRDLIQSKVDAINKELARVEWVRKFILGDHVFSVETGEMTPTLKFRRSEVTRHYRDQLEALYKEGKDEP